LVLLIVETVYELQGTYTQVILNKHTASKVWISQEVISIQMQLLSVEHNPVIKIRMGEHTINANIFCNK